MCVCVCTHTHVCLVPTRSEEGVISFGTRVTASCEPSCGCQEEPGSSGSATSTDEPTLQVLEHGYCDFFEHLSTAPIYIMSSTQEDRNCVSTINKLKLIYFLLFGFLLPQHLEYWDYQNEPPCPIMSSKIILI